MDRNCLHLDTKTRQELPADNWHSLEVWVDPTTTPPYILLLLEDTTGQWRIFDPTKEFTLLFSHPSYEEAKFWLLEDEYECVRGRLLNEAYV